MSMTEQGNKMILHIKDAMQSCNINFLMGSGLSRPYLITLGNIEILLEALSNDKEIDKDAEMIIRASLYKLYFEEVMLKNCGFYTRSEEDDKAYEEVIDNYTMFLTSLNNILLHRDNPLLTKQINIFTTNIDIFFEKTLENNNLEFNDGFKGRMKPIFALSNFNRTYQKTSLHYGNKAELPVFNLFKVHGSINWEKGLDKNPYIYLSPVSGIKKIDDCLSAIDANIFIEIDSRDSLGNLKTKAESINIDSERSNIGRFFEAYSKLQIVNPTKEKLRSTVLNNIYYEQLRMYANELEKESSILFAMGFSFADEHIREITLRVANANPTLKIYILAFDKDAADQIKLNINIDGNVNDNIAIVSPSIFSCDVNGVEEGSEKIAFDFNMMNKILFKTISEKVNKKRN